MNEKPAPIAPPARWHETAIDGPPPRGVLVVATDGSARWLDKMATTGDDLRLVFGSPATHWFPIYPDMPTAVDEGTPL